MCILSYLPAEVKPDADGLFNGGMNNPDGHGWAIVAGNQILVGKSLKLADALDEFVEVRERHLEGPALFHSRWMTHGKVNVANVHPFDVAGSARTVVAHNGIFRKAAHPEAGDPRSDSRKFADEILHRQFRRLDRPGVRNALRQWCGTNKLVILTVDPRYQEPSYIINENLGEWDKSTGIWHSNGDYRYVTQRHYYSSYEYDWSWPSRIGTKKQKKAWRKKAKAAALELPAPRSTADTSTDLEIWTPETKLWTPQTSDDETRCRFTCEGHARGEAGYCDTCWCCQDCGEHAHDCQCWCWDAHEQAALADWEQEEAARRQEQEEAERRLDARLQAAADKWEADAAAS